MNDRRLVIQGAQDYSIPQSHLTDMHEEVHIQQKGKKALQHITTMLKAESQEGYDEQAHFMPSLSVQLVHSNTCSGFAFGNSFGV